VRGVEISCGVAIAASLILGGATQKGCISDTAIQLASLPLLAFVISDFRQLMKSDRRVVAVLGLILALPIFQLIPLPPTVWMALPGRAAVTETYASAGLGLPWLGLSVSPWATIRVAFSLLPSVTIFLGVLACRQDERQRLTLLILLIGVASVFLSIVQILQGPTSPLRFYAYTSMTGIGFFANRNHTAVFINSLIPLGAILFEHSSRRRSGYEVPILLGFFLVVLLGLTMTGSRSALILGLIASVLTSALIMRNRVSELIRRKVWIYIAVGFLLMASLLAISFGLLNLLSRFEGDKIASDARWLVARISLEAAIAFFPFGSGLGTFERVFPLFQRTNTIIPATVNHAHNDLLEIVLEAGLAGTLIIAGWIALVALCAIRNMREKTSIVRKERMAGLIVLVLLFIHSFWDYPLRTSALAALFAFCCSILWEGVGAGSTSPGRDCLRARKVQFSHV
jgi:O-antigen ligase